MPRSNRNARPAVRRRDLGRLKHTLKQAAEAAQKPTLPQPPPDVTRMIREILNRGIRPTPEQEDERP